MSLKHKDRKLALVLATDLLRLAPTLDRPDPATQAAARVALVLAADDQPLVRLAAARLLALLPQPFLWDARASAQTLAADDPDPDVAAFANRSLVAITQRLAPAGTPDALAPPSSPRLREEEEDDEEEDDEEEEEEEEEEEDRLDETPTPEPPDDLLLGTAPPQEDDIPHDRVTAMAL